MAVIRKSGKRKAESGKRKEKVEGLRILSSPYSLLPSPTTDLTYQQAIAYLRGEALVLPPETPRGTITVSFLGYPLGPMKNLGSRANNLYPKEWRIKSTHIPQEYLPIVISA